MKERILHHLLWLGCPVATKQESFSRKDNKMAARQNVLAGTYLVQNIGSKLWNYVLTRTGILHKLWFTLVRAIVNKQIFFSLVRIA